MNETLDRWSVHRPSSLYHTWNDSRARIVNGVWDHLNKYIHQPLKDWECFCRRQDLTEQEDLFGNVISKICSKCGREYFETAYYMKFMFSKKEDKTQ